MNNVFDPKRFLLLTARHAHENRSRYLWLLGAIGALIFLWYLFVFFVDGHRPIDRTMQTATYFFGLAIGGCLYASLQFSDLSSRSKGIHYLTLPASHLEKILLAFLYSVVVFFVCYTLVFYIIDIFSVNVFNAWSKSYYQGNPLVSYGYGKDEDPAGIVNVFNVFLIDGNSASPLLLQIYLLVQSVFLLGSVYFERFSFIKTLISVLVIGFFIGLFIANVLYPMLPLGNFSDDLMTFRLNTSTYQDKAVQLPAWFGFIFWNFLRFGITIVFWITAYIRLKEKEI